MVLGFSTLGTILIMNTYNVCNPNTQAHIQQIPEKVPDSLHKPQESPSMMMMTQHSDNTKADKKTSDLQTGRVGLAPVADKDYKITIKVENNTVETGTEDFWFS